MRKALKIYVTTLASTKAFTWSSVPLANEPSITTVSRRISGVFDRSGST